MDTQFIQDRIHVIRGERVMLDRDLAVLYGVQTKRLNEQVKRNIERFPDSFMFQLTDAEKDDLVAICDRFASLKHSTVNPYAFTEHGALMASTVLNTEAAVKMSVFIIQAFVQFRRVLSSHTEIMKRLDALEKKVGGHDESIRQLVGAIRQLMVPVKARKKIGF